MDIQISLSATSPVMDAKDVKKLEKFWALFHKYRTKFPKTTPKNLEVFRWAREFSGVAEDGAVKLYRGTKIREADYAVGKKVLLTSDRLLASFSKKLSVAKEFALYEGKVGHAVSGTTYVLEAQIPAKNIVVSAPILKGIAKTLKKRAGQDASLLEWAEEIADQAYDLARHEDEYFVILDGLKATVKFKYNV